MSEKALVLIKPDGVQRALIGRVIERFETAGLKVIGIKMVQPTAKQTGEHYAEDKGWLMSVGKKLKASNKEKGIPTKETELQIGMRVRALLMKELSKSPVVAIVLEGNAANDVARKIAGATEPRKADPSTIRGSFSTDTYGAADAAKRPVRNIVHVSETAKAADREIRVWLTASELYKYKRCDEDVIV